MERHQGIYAVLDLVANDLLGMLALHKSEATAIRMFADIADAKGTIVNQHPGDFALLLLGNIFYTDDAPYVKIVPDRRIIFTGEQYLATQAPAATQLHLASGQ